MKMNVYAFTRNALAVLNINPDHFPENWFDWKITLEGSSVPEIRRLMVVDSVDHLKNLPLLYAVADLGLIFNLIVAFDSGELPTGDWPTPDHWDTPVGINGVDRRFPEELAHIAKELSRPEDGVIGEWIGFSIGSDVLLQRFFNTNTKMRQPYTDGLMRWFQADQNPITLNSRKGDRRQPTEENVNRLMNRLLPD